MSRRAVIIDTDPGVDDATALFMALGHPDVEVIAVTTVAGNCDVDTTTVNALALLGLVGLGDIPVARGSAEPLAGPPPTTGTGSHGVDGLGGARPPTIQGFGLQPGDAVDLMLSAIRSHGRPVTLIGIGPATNLARLCQDHPEALPDVDEIIVMGGSAGTGNHTPYAEFNTWYDPEALQVLVNSGTRLKIVGLDVTRAALLDESGLDQLPAGPVRNFLLKSHRTYGAALGGPHQTHLTEQHDAAAIAALIAPEIFNFQAVHVTVDGALSPTRGRTTILPDASGTSPVSFARAHDNGAFIRLLLDSLAACAAAVPTFQDLPPTRPTNTD